MYKLFELVAALDVVLRASGFCGKALVTLDLFMEHNLFYLVQSLFYQFIALLIGVALEGFPYVKRFFVTIWVTVQLALQDIRDDFRDGFRDGFREVFRNEVPADAPLREE